MSSGEGALGQVNLELVLGGAQEECCVSVRKLFFTFYLKVFPIALFKDHTSLPYQEWQLRPGTTTPSLLDDIEHDSALLWASVSLCANRKEISDH